MMATGRHPRVAGLNLEVSIVCCVCKEESACLSSNMSEKTQRVCVCVICAAGYQSTVTACCFFASGQHPADVSTGAVITESAVECWVWWQGAATGDKLAVISTLTACCCSGQVDDSKHLSRLQQPAEAVLSRKGLHAAGTEGLVMLLQQRWLNCMTITVLLPCTGLHPSLTSPHHIHTTTHHHHTHTLQAVGIEQDAHGAIRVNELSQTNVPGVWAIGDVTNRINLTPVALMEGMAFAKTCFGGTPTKPDYQNVASAVFCQPPLASVGCVGGLVGWWMGAVCCVSCLYVVGRMGLTAW